MHRPMLVARCLDPRMSPVAAQRLWRWLSRPVLHVANLREGRFRAARALASPASSRDHRGDLRRTCQTRAATGGVAHARARHSALWLALRYSPIASDETNVAWTRERQCVAYVLLSR